MGKTTADATTTAKQYVVDNLGANATAAFNLPSPLSSFMATNTGSGSALTQGVEIANGSDVRVALDVPAFTHFMRVAGIQMYKVRARTRCDATHGGSIVLPISVNRFPGYDRTGAKRLGVADTSLTLPQFYSGGKKPRALMVRDVLQRGGGILNQGGSIGGSGCDNDRRNWYDWPNLGSPTAATGPYHDACTAASEASPGPETVLFGGGATPNTGDMSFRGQIVLDARQIGTSPVFYNGFTSTSLNTWKQTAARYALTQYPGPDLVPGDQVGILHGNSTGQLLKTVGRRYKPGDIVTGTVYDGKVRRKGDFQLSVTCTPGQGPVSSGASTSCNNSGAGGSYVYRDAPPPDPASFFSGNCKFKGDYYIADPSAPGVGPLSSSLQKGTFYPATYVVHLAASETAQIVQLSARLSGLNTGAGGVGAPGDFGQMQVRWKDASGAAVTGWQSPNTPVQVTAPTGGVNLTFEVVQTATTSMLCGTTSVTVPDRVYGAHTIQVMGRAVGQAFVHSDYAILGMKNIAGVFDVGDYFISFVDDPFGTVQGGDTIESKLQFVDANSDPASETGLAYSTLPSAPIVNWYNVDGGAVPAGLAAEFFQDSDGDPALRVTVPDGAAAGLYAVDLQWNTNRPHSARFYVRVQSSSNPSIDTWVTVLCYARFKITDVGSNAIKGQAVSGCLDPKTNPQALQSTSRQQAWER
jgi:hypothetical protein